MENAFFAFKNLGTQARHQLDCMVNLYETSFNLTYCFIPTLVELRADSLNFLRLLATEKKPLYARFDLKCTLHCLV